MMQSGGIHAIELVLLLLLVFVVAFAALARKLQTPYPIPQQSAPVTRLEIGCG